MKDFFTIFINTSILYAQQYPLCRYHYRRAHPYKDLLSTWHDRKSTTTKMPCHQVEVFEFYICHSSTNNYLSHFLRSSKNKTGQESKQARKRSMPFVIHLNKSETGKVMLRLCHIETNGNEIVMIPLSFFVHPLLVIETNRYCLWSTHEYGTSCHKASATIKRGKHTSKKRQARDNKRKPASKVFTKKLSSERSTQEHRSFAGEKVRTTVPEEVRQWWWTLPW